MTKNPMQYVKILPRELRPLGAINSVSQLSDAMLTKLAKDEIREFKAKRFPRKKLN